MACSLRSGLNLSGSNNETFSKYLKKGTFGFCPSIVSLQTRGAKPRDLPVLSIDLWDKPLYVPDHKAARIRPVKSPTNLSVRAAQGSLCVSKALRWWEKTLTPNMVEVHSAQELANYLLNAEDRLVIVDFYSPGCGGCKALHPKICQLAGLNPNAIVLKVNYEELRTMCHALHIHVLPFFRFYRGAEGKVCSFSCTNATIKKFKDALAKHGSDRCSLGPAKGLDESELLKLASAGEISINLPLSIPKEERTEDLVIMSNDRSVAWSSMELVKDINMVKV